jgi:hypothetical protein
MRERSTIVTHNIERRARASHASPLPRGSRRRPRLGRDEPNRDGRRAQPIPSLHCSPAARPIGPRAQPAREPRHRATRPGFSIEPASDSSAFPRAPVSNALAAPGGARGNAPERNRDRRPQFSSLPSRPSIPSPSAAGKRARSAGRRARGDAASRTATADGGRSERPPDWPASARDPRQLRPS